MDCKEQAQRLAELYSDAILRLSYTYLKNVQDAEDVCQIVFVKLLSAPMEFDSPEHERAYILRMAANACKDLLKSAWRKKTCELEEGLEFPAPEGGFPGEESPVMAAVNSLPAKYRAVIYLHYYEGYRAREIAAILKIPAATVHTRLARGRARLKELLEEDGTEDRRCMEKGRC